MAVGEEIDSQEGRKKESRLTRRGEWGQLQKALPAARADDDDNVRLMRQYSYNHPLIVVL